MSLIKLCLEVSTISEDPKDPRLLPMTQRESPKPNKVKPNKNVLNWGMKE